MERPIDRVGLCAGCGHARGVASARGSVFWRCRLSDTDARFAKYPRLPVLSCPGFERRLDGRTPEGRQDDGEP